MSISVGVCIFPALFDFFAAVRESRGKAWPTALRARCSGLHSNSRFADMGLQLAVLRSANLIDGEQNAALPPAAWLCINKSS